MQIFVIVWIPSLLMSCKDSVLLSILKCVKFCELFLDYGKRKRQKFESDPTHVLKRLSEQESKFDISVSYRCWDMLLHSLFCTFTAIRDCRTKFNTSLLSSWRVKFGLAVCNVTFVCN